MQRFLFFLLPFLFILISCSEDFNTSAEFKDIPVVTGMLSVADTAHYIRVERAFLAPNQSAFEVAKNPDSIFYQNLDVKLEDVRTGRLYTMQEVDGNLEGFIREDGPFATTPNLLYKLRNDDIRLAERNRYRLLINRGDDFPLVTSETTTIDSFRLFSPIEGGTIRATPNANFIIRWEKKELAFLFDLVMSFHIREINSLTGSNEVITLDWNIVRRTTLDRSTFRGIQLIGFLANAGLERSNAITRQIESIDFTITAGGETLFQYTNLLLANQGITSTQEVPEFTNINGGRGIFCSRLKQIFPGFRLSAETINELRTNELTRDLNFF